MGRFSEKASYVWGAPHNRDEGYLVLSIDEMASQQLPHSVIIKWDKGVFSGGENEAWFTAGLCNVIESGQPHTIVVGNLGQTLELSGGGRAHGIVSAEVQSVGPLRRIRTIGHSVYVVGANRQVYRRRRLGNWDSINGGAKPDSDDNQLVGFESVDGFSETEIYGVGFNGEIWKYDGNRWQQIDSPTNLMLTEVCCSNDGHVYIGGRDALLFRGRNDEWETIDAAAMVDDIWSMACFKGVLFISGMRGLYKLAGDAVVPAEIDVEGVTSFYSLAKSAEVLWSVGAHDVIAFDGNKWTRID